MTQGKIRTVVVRDGRGNGLYEGECCDGGTCLRPPGHDGLCDQFDAPKSADSVPLHPIEYGRGIEEQT